jgi:hypothetical protein
MWCERGSGAAAMPWLIMAGRYVVGMGVGMSAVVVPQYVAELAPTSRRGQLTAMFEFVLCFGMLASTLMNTVLSPLPGTHQPLSPSHGKYTCDRSVIRALDSPRSRSEVVTYPRVTGRSYTEANPLPSVNGVTTLSHRPTGSLTADAVGYGTAAQRAGGGWWRRRWCLRWC